MSLSERAMRHIRGNRLSMIFQDPMTTLNPMVTIGTQIMKLLMALCESQQCSLILISHDLAVVANAIHQTLVMYLGRFCEIAPTKTLFSHPQHPYTRALISAIPTLTPHQTKPIPLSGEIPTPLNLPAGCVFNRRCAYANLRCQSEKPRVKADVMWLVMGLRRIEFSLCQPR